MYVIMLVCCSVAVQELKLGLAPDSIVPTRLSIQVRHFYMKEDTGTFHEGEDAWSEVKKSHVLKFMITPLPTSNRTRIWRTTRNGGEQVLIDWQHRIKSN